MDASSSADRQDVETFPPLADSPYRVSERTVRERRWFSGGASLNQGQAPSVIGFVWTHWLADRGLEVPGVTFDEQYALGLYRESQQLAGVSDDSGSFNWSAVRVLKSRGLVEECFACGDTETVLSALLERGPVVAGITWHESLYTPVQVDGQSVCRLDAVNSSVVGGHAVLLNGVALDLELGGTTGFVRFKNSWGPSWGDGGHAWISIKDLDQVMDMRDAVLPIPVADALRVGIRQNVAIPETPDGTGAIGESATDEGASQEQTPPRPAPLREYVRPIDDDPVGIDGDRLKRNGVAEALQSQLETLVRESPGRSFLVHIDGAWGTGKTSLLTSLTGLVDGSKGQPEGGPWLVVTYDAWRQSKAGFPWLTLLQTMRSAVSDSYRHVAGRVWFWVRERARLVNRWQWVAVLLMGVTVAALAVIVGGGTDFSMSTWGDVGKLIGAGVPALASVWLIAGSAGRFVSLDSKRSANAFLASRPDPMEDLASHFDWLIGQVKRPVLLVIDDLDRCKEDFVVELLDAVQKLMRDTRPREGEARPKWATHFLVVVAADGRWVRGSYDNTFASMSSAVEAPGSTVGSLFLEKLFQLRVPVPRLPEDVRAEFLSDLLSDRETQSGARPSDPDLERRLAEAPHDKVLPILASASPIDRVRASQVAIKRLVGDRQAQEHTQHALEPFGRLMDGTPRAMKRFVMAYSMLRAVRTAEGSVIGVGPLALWTIVLNRWPLLAEHLSAHPDAVRLMIDAGDESDEVPKSIPANLVTLFADPPKELLSVLKHADGPLDEQRIRECCGEVVPPRQAQSVST